MERDGACAFGAPVLLLSSMIGCFAGLWLRNDLKIFSRKGIEVSPMRIRFEDSE